MNLSEVLPTKLSSLINSYADITELRLRVGKPCRVKVGANWYYAGKDKLLASCNNALVISPAEIDECLQKACRNSVFAYEKMLANGFVVLDDGTRLGVAGKLNCDGKYVGYTSLCLRIAGFVDVADAEVINAVIAGKNVIIIGRPASGKTTYLRDVICKASQKMNVVVLDERGEVSLCSGFDKRSINCDVLLFCDKFSGAETAIRSLSPDCIAFDELGQGDEKVVERCVNSGIGVVCTTHGSVENALQSNYWLENIFDVVVYLSRDNNGLFVKKVLNIDRKRRI